MNKLFVLLLPLLLLTACEDETSKPAALDPGIMFNAFSVKSIPENQELVHVSGVKLYRDFFYESELIEGEGPDNTDLQLMPHPVTDGICLETMLPKTGKYTVKITNLLSNELYYEYELMTTNEAFQFMINCADSLGLWPSGKYKLELVGEDTTLNREFFIDIDEDQYSYYRPNYITDDEGLAFVPYENLYIGEKVEFVNPVGQYLGYKIIGAKQRAYYIRNTMKSSVNYEAVMNEYVDIPIKFDAPID